MTHKSKIKSVGSLNLDTPLGYGVLEKHYAYSRTGRGNISYYASRGPPKTPLLLGWLHGDKSFPDSGRLLGAAIEGKPLGQTIYIL